MQNLLEYNKPLRGLARFWSQGISILITPSLNIDICRGPMIPRYLKILIH
jgi:hypothetical protein